VTTPEFVLYHLHQAGDGPRFGFVVSRRVGRATVRNRTKRLLREACRALIPCLAVDVDIVVVAREPCAESSFSDLKTALEEAAARAGLTEGTTST